MFTAALMVLSCKSKEANNAPKNTPRPVARVDGFIVTTKNISEEISLPGSLAPFEETAIQSEVPGRVVGIYFKEGAAVSRGSLLIKLDDADLQAQIKKLQVQLSIAKKTEERQKQLLQINGISQQDYDLGLLSVNNIQADISILKTGIAKTSIRAPFAGKMGLRNISMGAYISPQTIISNIRELNRLKLLFTVPERYSSTIRSGGQIHFTTDGGSRSYPATVTATENNITEDTRSLSVKAMVSVQSPELIAGSFAKVQLKLKDNSLALMIPTQAIIPQARNKKVMVYRGGIAAMETVTTGLRDSAMVEVTAGLKQGDTILITGLLSTKPGAKVQLNSVRP